MNLWAMAVIGWVGLIFFSSTSLAAQWCEELFNFLASVLFSGLEPSSSPYGVIHLVADKGFHVFMFVMLALLLWRAIPGRRSKIWSILAIGLLVGSCSEFLQRFFPGRDPAVRDVLINLAGTALGVALSIAVTMRRTAAAQPL